MKRFVIYAFVVGILVGFFIGKFLKQDSSPFAPLRIRMTERESPSEKLEHGQTSASGGLSMPPKPEHEQTGILIPQSEIRIPQSENWSNVMLILEDEYRKKDWKGFAQTLEAIQGDEKYPLQGIIALLRNGFAQSAINSIKNMDAQNALFIAEGILKGNGSKNQKVEMLKTIGKKGKDAAALLKWVLENEKDVQITSLALNAMGETKDPALIPFLADYAKNNHELHLRVAAIEALENFDSDAIQPIEALLEARRLGEGNEDVMLKSAIVETLGNIGNSAAISLLSDITRRQTNLKDSEALVLQQDAITALGEIGSHEALSSIVEIITEEGADVELRSFALDILAKVKGEESVPILEDIISATGGGELEIKKNAIRALGDVKKPEAVPFLAELITRPNNETPPALQSEAISAMSRIAGPETVTVLESIVNNEYVDTEVRTDAVFALGKVGTETAVSVLERIVNDTPNPTFSRAALRGLQKIGSDYSISIIESAAREHPSGDIRLIATKLLETSRTSR